MGGPCQRNLMEFNQAEESFSHLKEGFAASDLTVEKLP